MRSSWITVPVCSRQPETAPWTVPGSESRRPAVPPAGRVDRLQSEMDTDPCVKLMRKENRSACVLLRVIYAAPEKIRQKLETPAAPVCKTVRKVPYCCLNRAYVWVELPRYVSSA